MSLSNSALGPDIAIPSMRRQTFPVLYKKSSTGKIQEWEIWVEGNVIHSRAGYTGMKMRTTSDTIKEGKNLGKVNATTPHEQAVAEAQAKHQKQLDKGFVFTPEDASAGNVTEHVGGGFFPMLAESYDDSKHHITFPCYVQPKLDGLRAPYKGGFFSRSRKPFTSVAHLEQAIKDLGWQDLELDGELYTHKLRDEFEEIVSAIKRQKTQHPRVTEVEYYIYDFPEMRNWNFQERFMHLSALFEMSNVPHNIKLVETIEVQNEEELQKAYEFFMEEGYEGAMVRNFEGTYSDKRSRNLQKVKMFQDAEFRIVGIDEGRGQLQGHVGKFICEISDDRGPRTFEAKLAGEKITPFLKECFEDHSLWEGKWLKVKFQGYTTKNFVPRFPVGLSLREAE